MTAAFFITLREGLEAALIVGIVLAYLAKVGRRDATRLALLGVGLALLLSLVLGVGIWVTIGRLPLTVQATFEGLAAIAAVVVLTWMLFWMRRQGRAMKGQLESEVAAALDKGSTRALVGLAFVAVIREGLETVLFLTAILSSSGNVALAMLFSIAGLAVAVAIGWAIFRLGKRIDLRKFFTITGVVLIFVSAGLCAYAVHELVEAGWLPVTSVAFDLTKVLPESSPLGSVLAGLLGYRAAPTVLELIAYLAYLIPVLTLFVMPTPPRLFRNREAPVS